MAGNAYKVIEVKAPDGYTMLEDAFEFTVDANGSATVTTEADGYTLSSEGGVITVKAADAQTELDIAKVSTEGASLAARPLRLRARLRMAPKVPSCLRRARTARWMRASLGAS